MGPMGRAPTRRAVLGCAVSGARRAPTSPRAFPSSKRLPRIARLVSRSDRGHTRQVIELAGAAVPPESTFPRGRWALREVRARVAGSTLTGRDRADALRRRATHWVRLAVVAVAAALVGTGDHRARRRPVDADPPPAGFDRQLTAFTSHSASGAQADRDAHRLAPERRRQHVARRFGDRWDGGCRRHVGPRPRGRPDLAQRTVPPAVRRGAGPVAGCRMAAGPRPLLAFEPTLEGASGSVPVSLPASASSVGLRSER
jgi:hypothetical protein